MSSRELVNAHAILDESSSDGDVSIPVTSLFNFTPEQASDQCQLIRESAFNLKQVVQQLSANLNDVSPDLLPEDVVDEVKRMQDGAEEYIQLADVVHGNIISDVLAHDPENLQAKREKIRSKLGKEKKMIYGQDILKESQVSKKKDELPSLKDCSKEAALDEGIEIPIIPPIGQVGSLLPGVIPDSLRHDLISSQLVQSIDQSNFHISINCLRAEGVQFIQLMQESVHCIWENLTASLQLCVGMPVVVRCKKTYKNEQQYYRGIIGRQVDALRVQVYLVDLGLTRKCDMTDLGALPQAFVEMPALAIACTLPGIDQKKLTLYYKEKFAAGFPRLPCEILVIYAGEKIQRLNGTYAHEIEIYHPISKKRITAPFIPSL